MAASASSAQARPDHQIQLLERPPPRPPGDRQPAVGHERRAGPGGRDHADQPRRLGLGQQLQLQGGIDRLEVVEPHRHDERGDEHARERRKLSGQGDAHAQDAKRGIGERLLAHEHQPEDGGERQEARDLAHALGDAGLGPVEARALDGEVVEQRRPAGEAQIVDEAQRHHEGDGRGAEAVEGGGEGHGRSSSRLRAEHLCPLRVRAVNEFDGAAAALSPSNIAPRLRSRRPRVTLRSTAQDRSRGKR